MLKEWRKNGRRSVEVGCGCGGGGTVGGEGLGDLRIAYYLTVLDQVSFFIS